MLMLVLGVGFGLICKVGGIDAGPGAFAVLFGVSQLLGLWVMAEMLKPVWPSKRFERVAVVVMALGIVVMSLGLGWSLWVER